MLERCRFARYRDLESQDSRVRADRSSPVTHLLARRLALHTAVAISLITVLLISPGSSGGGIDVRAQEATPEAIMPMLTGDLGFMTYADFGTVDAATLLAAPVGWNIFQLELAPGADVVYPPGDPGMGGHLVESGTLTLREFSTDIMVTRAPRQPTPETTTAEVLPAGAETHLWPGDGFLFPPLAAGEFRNDGTEPVVLAISVLFPTTDMEQATSRP